MADAAACKVQRAFRCFQARGLYYELVGVRAAAVVLQSAWRCHSARESPPAHTRLVSP